MPIVTASIEPQTLRIPQTATAQVMVTIKADAGHSVSLSTMASPATTGDFDDTPPTEMPVPPGGVVDASLTWRPRELAHQTIDLAAFIDGDDADPGQYTLQFDVDRVIGRFETSPTAVGLGQATVDAPLFVAERIVFDQPFDLAAIGMVPSLNAPTSDVVVGVFEDDGGIPGSANGPSLMKSITSNDPVEFELATPIHFEVGEVRWVVAMFQDSASVKVEPHDANDLTVRTFENSAVTGFPNDMSGLNTVVFTASSPVMYVVARAPAS